MVPASSFFFAASFALEQQQARLQHAHRGGAVLDLALLVLHRDDEACRQVGDAHRGVGRVDRLTARARRAEHVDADVAFGHLDLDGLFERGDDLDRGERRLALVGAAERADARETMRAGLDRQGAVGVGASTSNVADLMPAPPRRRCP
jgi:hypothetical protein